MNPILLIAGIIIVFIFYRKQWKGRRSREKTTRLIKRFLRIFKDNKNLIAGYEDKDLESFTRDPDKNIILDALEGEFVLLKKADIHQTRLSKFGRSKINGQMIFKGPRGGIYIYTNTGRKVYVY